MEWKRRSVRLKDFNYAQVTADEYIVMPNHVHGVINIRRGTAYRAPTVEHFGKPINGSLATIIRSYKSAVTKQINRMRDASGVSIWQRNYYEHVIRDDRDLARIREYMAMNPAQWEEDENFRIA